MQGHLLKTSLPLVLVAGLACNSDSTATPPATTVRDSAGIQIVESSAPASSDTAFISVGAEPLLAIGLEEGDEKYQLHRVFDAYRFADGRTAIGNSGTSEIRVFDASGKYVLTLGRKGAGPGEFSEQASIHLHAHHDTLLATDGRLFRLNVFSPDARFVETRPFDVTGEFTRPFMQGVFDDGTWLVQAFDGGGSLGGPPGAVLEGGRFSLLRYDAHGKRMNDITRVTDRPRFVHQFGPSISYPYIPLTAAPLHSVAGHAVVLHRGPAPEIELYSSMGQLSRIIRWSRPMTKTADVWESVKARTLAAASERQRPQIEDLYNRELPLPEFVPSYSAIAVDSEGSVWLQRYRLAGDRSNPVWDIIGANGAWLGSASTPRGFTVYRIGDDYVLGKQTDSLGVERVQVRALRMRNQR